MYKTLVRSHLDYCDVIQYQAALAITGAWQGSSCSKIYDELGCFADP